MFRKIAEQFKLNKMFRYLLIGCVATVGAGAAVGTVLDGLVAGDVRVTVSQALLIGRPDFIPDDENWADSVDWVQGVDRQTLPGHHSQPDRYIATVSDDQTRFQASVEIDSGDIFLIALPLKNASDQDAVVNMKLVYPELGDCEDGGCCDEDWGAGTTGEYAPCDFGDWQYLMDTDGDGKIVLDAVMEKCYIITDELSDKLEIKNNSSDLNIILQQYVNIIKIDNASNINIWAEQGYGSTDINVDHTTNIIITEGPGPAAPYAVPDGKWFSVEVFGSDEESQSAINNTTN